MTDDLAIAMRRRVITIPSCNLDGWQDGDFWACYDFPGKSRWWFQVRNGKLVNYDPAVIASQSQARLPILFGR